MSTAIAAGNAFAQDYPAKPIRFIVGPGPDALARVIGQQITQAWGQPVIIDQRGGGGGTISAEAVARAAPDGYTLLLATGTHTINPSMYKVSYDMVRDFAPVTLLASTPFILAVHPSVPANSVGELIGLARSKPGTLNFDEHGRLINVFVFDVADGVIQTIRSIINPDKLAHLGYPLSDIGRGKK